MALPRPGESAATHEIHELIRLRLRPRFAEFKSSRSTAELEVSPVYQELRKELAQVLDSIDIGDFRTAEAAARPSYRIVAWNIERGTEFSLQAAALENDPYLREADILLITEADAGMSRSGNVDVIREIARKCRFAYAFAPCYLNLEKGSGPERRGAGENELGLHGNAILSRHPIRDVHTVRLPNGVDKMAGLEKRLGSQRAVVATVDLPDGEVCAVCAHLDVQASQRHRAAQMRLILDGVRGRQRVVIGGDWNTNTYDGSRALHMIVGFARRVLMGVDRTIRNHFLHPERFFERHLFRLLEEYGFDYRGCNRMGEQTAAYGVTDPRHRMTLRDWVPAWCLAFIRWGLRHHNGECPMKLDWLATRGIAAANPTILHEIRGSNATPLSDHDAIGVDIRYSRG